MTQTRTTIEKQFRREELVTNLVGYGALILFALIMIAIATA